MRDSDRVRAFVIDHYVVPARGSGAGTVTVRAGDVHRALNWDLKKVPQVCSALSTRKFLNSARVELIAKNGPPSGQSTTVEFVFRLLETNASSQPAHSIQFKETVKPKGVGLMAAYGILKDAYREFGGGEAYLNAERAAWGPDPWEKTALARKQNTENLE